MTLQDWGALGELVGGVAIIVSLIYVSLQIRQSTRATRTRTMQAFTSQYVDGMQAFWNPHFADIYRRGLPGLQNLDENERVTFVAWTGMALRIFESYYFQKEDGDFDSRLFDGWNETFVDLLANEGPREVIEIRKHHFNTQFIEYIRSSAAATTPKDMYSMSNE